MATSTLDPGGLPRVTGYGLPAEAPAQRVSWAVDPDRAALLIHDVQNYFLRAFPSGEEPVPTLLANIRALRDRCDGLGIPVFYTAQTGHQDRRDRGLQADLWGPGMGGDPTEVEIVEELAPAEEHAVLTKWRYSAFQRTTLEPMLVARDRDQLLVTGVYAQIGCLLSATDAFMRDIHPFFVIDAVADFSRERHLAAVQYVTEHCGRTLPTRDLLDQL